MSESWFAENARQALHSNFELICNAAGKNEANTRIRAIDTMLYDVLKWQNDFVDHEKHVVTAGYADYVCQVGKDVRLVIEAKKDSDAFILSDKEYPDEAIPFRLIAEESKEAKAAMYQVHSYASKIGAQYMSITNGRQWLMALTFVQSQEILDRMVLVFESLDAIKKRFRAFFECFGPSAVNTNLPSHRLNISINAPAPARLSTKIEGYPGDVDRKADFNRLRTVLPVVWEGITHNQESPIFLSECYINPDPQEDMLLVAKEWLSQRSKTDAALSSTTIPAPAEPDAILETIKSSNRKSSRDSQPSSDFERPIVLLGRVGHGKTTFLKYLRNVKAKEILEDKYLQIDLDFTEEPATADEVPEYVLREIESQLKKTHKIEIDSDSFVRQALKEELRNFPNTSRGRLAKSSSDPRDFANAEVDFIETFTRDRFTYLGYVVSLIRKGYGKSIAIFFDNLDRRKFNLQEQAFLRASSLAKRWSAIVFVCLRPGTVYDSKTTGVLDSVPIRTLYISPPKTVPLLRKRFQYAEKFARKKLPPEAYPHATISTDLQKLLPNAADFFHACDESIHQRPTLAQQFEAAANGNVRQILQYVGTLLVSNHLDTSSLADESAGRREYILTEQDTLRVLLLGQHTHFEPSTSIFLNLFQISRSNPIDHFSRLYLMEFFHRSAINGENRGFVTVNAAQQYMSHLGYSEPETEISLNALFEKKCLENRLEDTSNEEQLPMGKELRASALGQFHISTLVRRFAYIDAVIVDTPILDPKIRPTIQDAKQLKFRLERARTFLRYLDQQNTHIMDATAKQIWLDISIVLASNITDLEKQVSSDK